MELHRRSGGAEPLGGHRARVPAYQTELAVEVAKALKAKGFKFCGPVITYAFMQAVGMVNDHVTDCFRHREVAALARQMRGASELQTIVCGVDEAGRGPWAGPVFAAAVILSMDGPIEGLDDSKKLPARQRETLEVHIKARALAWAVGSASVEEIDVLNILQATGLADAPRGRESLSVSPDPGAG